MGLFSLLKNGFTIEKKKQPEQPAPQETIEENIDEELTTEEELEETQEEQPAPTPEPATIAEKRLEAEYILYGDTNPVIAQKSTPVTPTPEIKPEPTPAPVQQTYHAYSNVTSNFNNALLGQVSANQNLLVISPKSPDEISAILSNLASGNACIVSLANISDAQRHLDYICGFMNAIGGTIMQRTQTEYILTPKGVGIKS